MSKLYCIMGSLLITLSLFTGTIAVMSVPSAAQPALMIA